MHSLLEGVVKNFFNYWFNSKIHSEYSLVKYMQEIDNRLLAIQPPKYIPSTPRTIYSFNIWRAHEYCTFILYYALPVNKGLMGIQYYNNLKNLVIIIENLLLPSINVVTLNKVDSLIRYFVKELIPLYPQSIMLSGVHELLHLVECTITFGPLNSFSLFPFEEINRKLLRF